MKALTADKVLRKTFEHLDTILAEKNRQMQKSRAASYAVAPSNKKRRQDRRYEGDSIAPGISTSGND